jgi:hypothetical protein
MVGQMVIMAMYIGCIAICVVNMDGDKGMSTFNNLGLDCDIS